jgi:hypothetical protein
MKLYFDFNKKLTLRVIFISIALLFESFNALCFNIYATMDLITPNRKDIF